MAAMDRRLGLWARALCMGIALVMLCSAAGAADRAVLAWHRFDDGRQEYLKTPYRFLGDGDLRVVIDVLPAAGHALELHWGAKNDMRAASIAINGVEKRVVHGQYDGFRWLSIPVPEGGKGERYDVIIRSGGGVEKAAFLAEIRLTGDEAPGVPSPDLKQRSSKMTVSTQAANATRPVEAFAEMRALWDRQPAARPAADPATEPLFRQAEKNARDAAEALYRSRRFVDGWLAHADPKTGLIPRNLKADKDIWNGRDAAADNYPFMVLTTALTDRPLFEGRMLEMLRTEAKLTSRVDRLCDNYRFSTGTWARPEVDLDAIIFDSTEYVKDGLLPLTEWLGKSPWSERMIGLIDDAWKHAVIDTPHGKIPTLNFEVNGDFLQACSRLYWFTGERKYLDWAIRLGDYYLLGDRHPTRNMETLPLRDHGCEVINGLSELYLACAHAAPEKREQYRKPLHELYDRILELGINEHGMMYNSINTKTGQHAANLSDNWGYNYDGFYTLWLLDRKQAYRDAVRKALTNLKAHYVAYAWEGNNADGYADSIEGAINLLNREPVDSAFDWVDSEIRIMWSKQKPDGVIEGWHGDGNSARTSVMYALWKMQGAHVEPWRADVRLGAVMKEGKVYISLAADQPWSGKVIFDRQRHRENLKLPIDYPRINQFPEWFTVTAGDRIILREAATGKESQHAGQELRNGLPVDLKAGVEVRWVVSPAR